MLEMLIQWAYPAAIILGAMAALGALSSGKGSDWHRRAGRLCFWAMLIAAACAIWNALGANAYLTLLLGLLGGYLMISGYRALYLKRPVPRATFGPTRAGALDKGLAQLLLVTCCAVSAWGMMMFPSWMKGLDDFRVEPMLMIVLGLAGAMLALRDLSRFRNLGEDPHKWLSIHVTRMLSGLTFAAVVAGLTFLDTLPEAARWMIPAGIGASATFLAARLVARHVGAGGDPRSVYDVRIAEPERDSQGL